ncbi:hypothetical protein [Solicola sp. PLA-1-18]|uniref:hypothetical protein n=1 Tax=Solicola sp. PLA-1-18 TaxID=3380532 RepID=UPI003B829456
MSETSDEAAARRRRIKVLNVIAVVVSVALVIFLRFGLTHLPESAQWPIIIIVLVGIVVMLAVFVVLIRRQWGADFRRAVLTGEVAPDANRAELRRDLEKARPNKTFVFVQSVVAVAAGIALAVGGLVAGIWWLSLIGLAIAIPMPVLLVYTRKRRHNLDQALAALKSWHPEHEPQPDRHAERDQSGVPHWWVGLDWSVKWI